MAAATTLYSLALVVSPRVLAKPCGLTRPDGSVPRTVAMLTRSVGLRDAVLSVLLLAAEDERARRRLSIARVIADGGDAIWFGRLLPDSRTRRKAAVVASLWAALETATAAYEARR